ncbi:hypothetical protein J31TS4_16450 [Paenibacillus sp. J31TS4]|uniref:MmcQ/YjbR family DNA-binding protein n=1 Tax=Paenibacillus sp. J31TS4 TaxID=2807195 RepID=UPI001B0A114D|nr:MmcQ/YjbR family DNA-binding protein [Paenibacillus sp. J31TS4]GIP38365.1 hypothetical protein J31TS4_16450 [Paenibacillus sp. J31TS4]
MVTTDEIRSLALSLPGTEERDHGGKPSFRVRNKIFAVLPQDGLSLVVKTTKDDRFLYTTMAPDIYLVPDSFEHLAFMVVRMDRVDPEECRELLIQAWKRVSPKKIVQVYDEALKGRERIGRD